MAAECLVERVGHDLLVSQRSGIVNRDESSKEPAVSAQNQISVRIDPRPAGRVAHVAIANERRLNSMNSALMAEFVETMARLGADEALRAVVLTGAGDKAFIGGADIREMGAVSDPEGGRAFIRRVHASCHAIRQCPVPVIARINGFTLGAGLEMAAACDMRVAVDTAVFGMPEVKLGIPSVVEAALLPQLIGWGRTREILLAGETFDAAAASRWGMVEYVETAATLDARVETLVAAILTSKPRAVRIQKSLIRAWEDLPTSRAVDAGIDAFGSAFETSEPRDAMAHFFAEQERRKAR